MEAEDVVGHPLCFGRGVENLTAVLFEHGDPGLEVARVIGNVARQSDHGSDGDGGQLGSKLFFRVKNRSEAAAQIAVQPRGMAAGMGELVQDDDSQTASPQGLLARRPASITEGIVTSSKKRLYRHLLPTS